MSHHLQTMACQDTVSLIIKDFDCKNLIVCMTINKLFHKACSEKYSQKTSSQFMNDFHIGITSITCIATTNFTMDMLHMTKMYNYELTFGRHDELTSAVIIRSNNRWNASCHIKLTITDNKIVSTGCATLLESDMCLAGLVDSLVADEIIETAEIYRNIVIRRNCFFAISELDEMNFRMMNRQMIGRGYDMLKIVTCGRQFESVDLVISNVVSYTSFLVQIHKGKVWCRGYWTDSDVINLYKLMHYLFRILR